MQIAILLKRTLGFVVIVLTFLLQPPRCAGQPAPAGLLTPKFHVIAYEKGALGVPGAPIRGDFECALRA